MINRVLRLVTEAQGDEQPYGDFVVVSGEFGAVCVTRETAGEIERQLDRLRRPEWIVFSDRVGSRIRVRACAIRAICESTEAQRAGDRRLERARRREEESDRRPWDDLD
ncbi:MAG TPA: hypothetical protein VFS05_04485 [Gemmatimonadaceae bacterium]|nr:hypothetical protein [Gemmatimonadaceae bacterium]